MSKSSEVITKIRSIEEAQAKTYSVQVSGQRIADSLLIARGLTQDYLGQMNGNVFQFSSKDGAQEFIFKLQEAGIGYQKLY